MEKTDKTIYVVVIVFAILVLGGFFFLFNKIGNLQTDLKNSELSFEAYKNQTGSSQTNASAPINPPVNPVPNQNPKQNNNVNSNPPAETAVDTAILFDATSSAVLQPQTKITINIEKVSKAADGKITVGFKAFTSEATGYSAFEPRDFFEVVNLNGDNIKPISVTGNFTSLAPKSSTAGEIIFKITPDQNTLILQINAGENIKFYEFNFTNQTYKETILG